MLSKEDYEAKREARYNRLVAAAERAEKESAATLAQADKMASIIPFGQPILVGHYSEKSDRRYRERIHNKMRRGYDLYQHAQDLKRRAEASRNCHTIFSDDPSAVEKLEDKIARLEKRQAAMVKANRLLRKNDRAGLLEMGYSEPTIARLMTPDFCGRIGYPDYEIKNNGANIRRLKTRIETVQAHASDETTETEAGGVRIVDSVEDNRVQVYFPGKPSESCRSELKSFGFHWTPSIGAWQRFRGNGVVALAQMIVAKYYPAQG